MRVFSADLSDIFSFVLCCITYSNVAISSRNYTVGKNALQHNVMQVLQLIQTFLPRRKTEIPICMQKLKAQVCFFLF